MKLSTRLTWFAAALLATAATPASFAQDESDDADISIESFAAPGRHIRHWYSVGFVSVIAPDTAPDARFKKVKGLASADGISFRSHNYPKHYLRFQDGRLVVNLMNTDADKKDATFFIVKGLAADVDGWLSLRSMSQPDRLVLAAQGEVKVLKRTGDEVFARNATLRFVKPVDGIFPGLETLSIEHNRISDAGLLHLKDLPRLQHIYLRGNSITGTGLKSLRAMKNLRTLSASACPLTEAGLMEIGALTTLHTLDLSSTPLQGAWLRHLKDLRGLHKLHVENAQITDEVVLTLLDIKLAHALFRYDTHLVKTKSINLRGTRVTDAVICRLATNPCQSQSTGAAIVAVRSWSQSSCGMTQVLIFGPFAATDSSQGWREGVRRNAFWLAVQPEGLRVVTSANRSGHKPKRISQNEMPVTPPASNQASLPLIATSARQY